MKYDGTLGVREHILSMQNIVSKLEQMDMSISEKYLIQFILDSLPSSFGLFKVAYNQNPTPWTITKLIARCDQEERRLKAEGQLMVNLVSLITSPRERKRTRKGQVLQLQNLKRRKSWDRRNASSVARTVTSKRIT